MKGKFGTGVLAIAAGALMSMAGVAYAQAPAGGPGAGPPRAGGGMGMGMGMGMGGQLDRAGTVQRFALDDAALKLTAAQKAEVDKAVDAYVTEMTAVNAKHPFTPGSPPSQEGMDARTKARDNLTAAVNKVLNDEQRKTWETAQAARRPAGGPGGMGGAGGMGGPGGAAGGAPRGARPPGGAGQ